MYNKRTKSSRLPYDGSNLSLIHIYVQVTGLFTHFADADGEEEGYTRRQAEAFARVVARVRGAGYAPMVHAANSAALYRFPELSFDCVRAGIAMYGYGLHDRPEYGLQPVMSWQTRVANVKTVPAGAKLSYGCTYEAETERRIATLPVGYADGYRRAFSNRGMVLIRGQRAPVAGRVCMDQIMVEDVYKRQDPGRRPLRCAWNHAPRIKYAAAASFSSFFCHRPWQSAVFRVP